MAQLRNFLNVDELQRMLDEIKGQKEENTLEELTLRLIELDAIFLTIKAYLDDARGEIKKALNGIENLNLKNTNKVKSKYPFSGGAWHIKEELPGDCCGFPPLKPEPIDFLKKNFVKLPIEKIPVEFKKRGGMGLFF